MRRSSAPLFVGLFAAALTLRPQLVGAAPLFPIIQHEQHVRNAVVGLLGTLPVLCMGLFAPIAPVLRSRYGTIRAISLSLGLIGLFGLARLLAPIPLVLVSLTFGLGAGMGLAGALLPVLVKEHFESSSLRASGTYSAGLQLGSTLSALVAVPIAVAFGGWRIALLVFSLVTIGLTLAWVRLSASSALIEAGAGRRVTARSAISNPLAWRLAIAFALFGIYYYGLTAWLTASYVERGWTLAAAAGLVATLNAGSLGGAIAVPLFSQRIGSRTRLVSALAMVLLVAAVVIAVAPNLAYGAVFVAGLANGMLFPALMAIPVDLTKHAQEVGSITSVMLGVGYTLAAIAPAGLGAVRDLSGSFRPVLWLIVLAGGVLLLISLSFDALPRRG